MRENTCIYIYTLTGIEEREIEMKLMNNSLICFSSETSYVFTLLHIAAL